MFVYRNGMRRIETEPVESQSSMKILKAESVRAKHADNKAVLIKSGLEIPRLSIQTLPILAKQPDNYISLEELARNNNFDYNPSNFPDAFHDLELELPIDLQFEPRVYIEALQPSAGDDSNSCCCCPRLRF